MSVMHPELVPTLPDERALVATRVAAMLDRWEMEDVSDEPEWTVEEIVPVGFRATDLTTPRRSKQP